MESMHGAAGKIRLAVLEGDGTTRELAGSIAQAMDDPRGPYGGRGPGRGSNGSYGGPQPKGSLDPRDQVFDSPPASPQRSLRRC